MTIRDLIIWLGQRPGTLALVLAIPLLVTLVLSWLHPRRQGGRAPWRYLYAAILYLTCFPGICAAVLTGYALFFTRENLLDVNALVYVLPIVGMVVTLMLVHKAADFAEIPGFDRIQGLMAVIGGAFVVALAIQKTHIGVLFFASVEQLLLLVIALVALIKWGGYMLFRRRDEPKASPPSWPKR